jgi:denticleless
LQDDNTLISCGAGDGVVKVWDLRRNYSLSKKEPFPKYSLPYAGHSTFKGFTNLSIDNSGRRLYVNCMDNHIYCYNIATFENEVVQTYRGFKNGTFYIKSCLSPDDQYLISGSSDEKAYIWNVDHEDPVAVLNGHTVEVTCVAWSKIRGNEDCIVTCSEDARHKIWRLGPAEVAADEVARYRGSASFSQDYRPSVRVNPRKRKLPPPLDFTPKSIRRLMERNETTPSSTEKQPPQTPQTSQALVSGTKRTFSDMCEGDEEEAAAEVPEAKRPSQESRGRRLFAGCGGKNLDLMATDEKLLDSPETRRPAPLSPGSPRSFRSSPLCEKIDFNVISPETPSTSRALSSAVVEASTSAAATAILFSPTTNLPNFVVDRQAPHLRIISPKRKLKENVDWLTKMRKQKILSSACSSFNAKLSGVALSPRLEALKTSERSPRSAPKRRLSRSGSTHNEAASPKSGGSTTPRRNSSAESTILRFLTITATASPAPLAATSNGGASSSSQSTSPTSTPVPSCGASGSQ